MRRILLIGLVVSFSLLSCEKEKNVNVEPGDDFSPREQAINDLLESAGTLTNEESRDIKPEDQGDPDTLYLNSYTTKLATDAPHYRKTQRKKVDFFSSSSEFTLLNPWASIVWPGCLIQGRTVRGAAVPSAIPLYKKRLPGRILFQVVSGGNLDVDEQKWFIECEEMRESEVLSAQNMLLRQFLKGNAPADLSCKIDIVRSSEELMAYAGINVKAFGGTLESSFVGNWNTSRSHVLVKLTQRYFTMSYEDPDGGFRGVFNESITAEDLKPYTGSGNPICYVSSVSYGRVYYLLYESNYDAEMLKAALAVQYKHFNNEEEVKINFDYKKVVSSSTATLLQYGGNAKEGLKTMSLNSFEDVTRVLQEGAEFDEDHVGAPISFTVKHLYSADIVNMQNTLTYEYDEVSFIPKGDENILEVQVVDFAAEGFGDGKWTTSPNHSKIRLTNLSMKTHSSKGEELEHFDFPVPPHENTLKYEKVFNLYRSKFFNLEQELELSKIEITLEGDIDYETYRSGEKRVSESEKFMMKFFVAKVKGGWELQDAQGRKLDRGVQTQSIRFRHGVVDLKFALNAFLNNERINY